MNFPLVFGLVGRTLKFEILMLAIPLFVAVLYGENISCYLLSMLLLAVVAFPLSKLKVKNKALRAKEGFATVALTWIALSAFGALPFYFSGYFNSYVDSLFEAISGFTTTGATILPSVEQLPRGILFWRGLTHLIGGMGILVFMMTLTATSASSVNLLKAESTGPAPSKLVPKIKETARILYTIYFAMTAILVILLCLTGMPLFDSLFNAMSTAGTGGFASMNLSIAAYNNVAAEVVISIFMFLFGINFTLYYYIIKKNFKEFFRDEELRLYIGVVLTAIAVITLNIIPIYGSVSQALRHSSFQVSSIITTTGYATTNFNEWPDLSKAILLILMLTGCSAGSTGGGIKLVRILLVIKNIRVEISKMLHPRVVRTVRLQGKNVSDDTISSVMLFICIYCLFFLAACCVLSIENPDLVTTITSVIATMSNVGPGLGRVGPLGNFGFYEPLSKLMLSFCMLAGRLEFYPMLILLAPSLWRKSD